ncbi:hypothetical protein NOF04DRAFT_1338057 [Fusarium oxysporum II5]|nr:hypothetical protein NOF04DRAFT_1338057 [Fusarium oxysporum II5]
MHGRYSRYWIVRDDSNACITSDTADIIIRYSAVEEIITSSQARLKEEDAMKLQKGYLEEDIDRNLS